MTGTPQSGPRSGAEAVDQAPPADGRAPGAAEAGVGAQPPPGAQAQAGDEPPAGAPADPDVEGEVVEVEVEAPAEPDVEPEPDFRDQWLRAAADLENVRRRARRDVAAAESRGIARLARELLPSLDNLDRALAAAEGQPENADHHLTDGIRLVQSELLAALARVGISQDAPVGEPFDPHVHEAIAQQPASGVESGAIVTVVQPGYRFGDDVLRAAKVVVAA